MRALPWAVASVAAASVALLLLRASDHGRLDTIRRFPTGVDLHTSTQPRVLILTPLFGAAAFLPHYAGLLDRLIYPHSLISVAMLAPEHDDDPATADAAAAAARDLGRRFRRVHLVKKTVRPQVATQRTSRHEVGYQYHRRKALAMARNMLLSAALGDEDWVLWVDADLADWPDDLVQQLLASNKSVVVPNVVQSPGGRSYDLNSWQRKPDLVRPPFGVMVPTPPVRDFAAAASRRCMHLVGDEGLPTPPEPIPAASGSLAQRIQDALRFGGRGSNWTKLLAARGVPADVVTCVRGVAKDAGFRRDVRDHVLRDAAEMHLEGYASPAVTLPLHKLKPQGRLVELGGVGGAVLLVRADLHRAGLTFPPYLLHNRIETEGLAVMARLMGVSVWGMPYLEVIHTRH